jgi:hypothetical protein
MDNKGRAEFCIGQVRKREMDQDNFSFHRYLTLISATE